MSIFYPPDIEVWYVPEDRVGPAFEFSEPGWYYARRDGPAFGPCGSEFLAVAAACRSFRKPEAYNFMTDPNGAR